MIRANAMSRSRPAGPSKAGKTLVVAGEGLEVTGSLPHGHVAAVHAQAQCFGLGVDRGDVPVR